MLLVLGFMSVSADEVSVVTTADGIEMSSLTYEDEALSPETDITVKLTAKRTEATDTTDKIILVASLMDNGVMTAIDTDSKELGTEPTEFEATLTLPEDISNVEITVALLKQTTNGLVPISSSSYRPGKTEFLPIKSASLAGEELVFDEENTTKVVLAPKATEFPEGLKVETADTATKIDWTTYNEEGLYCGIITATLPDGDSIEYMVNFENATHYFTKAKTDDDFTDINTWSDWNMVSKDVVMNAWTDYKPSNMPETYGDKKDDQGKDTGLVVFENYRGKVFTNLHGIDPDQPELGGSRLFANYPANYRQRHAINYVDPLYEGCDYIVTSNGAMTTDQSVIYYDFDLAYDAEVVIITLSQCTNYPKDGYVETKNTSTNFLTGSYINLTYTNPLVNNLGISPTMTEVQAFEKKANGKLATSSEYYEACEEMAASISARTGKELTAEYLMEIRVGQNEKDTTDLKVGGATGGTFRYQYAYTKKFEVPEGEESVNVKIKAPDKAQARGFIVVIKPVEE